ncbi:MAG: 6-phosphogluconolactonase [Pseudomonadota bacterium]
MMTQPQWQTESDAEAVAAAAAADLASLLEAGKGPFHIALAGGRTPERLYRRLAGMDLPWQRLHVWFGDERAVPPDDPDSNERMSRQALLDHVPIPPEQIHPMRPAVATIRQDAAAYRQELARYAPRDAGGWPALDLVLLGMGPDGHTASLFPGTCALHETDAGPGRSVVANYVPRLRAWRMTLTYPAIHAARGVWLLATGAEKADAVARLRAGDASVPVARLDPVGEYRLFVDRAAAGEG